MPKLYISNIHVNDTPDLNILSALGIQNNSSPLTQSILQSLINCTNLLFIITDPKGIIQLFSPGAEVILGYKASEVKNRLSVIDLCDPKDLIARTDELNIEFKARLKPGFETIAFIAAKGIEDYCALKCLSKKGREIQIEVSITALLDDSENHFGYMLTGTESHYSLQEESIQKTLNRKIISYLDNAPTGVFIADSKGNYVQVNQAACEVTGYTKTELLDMNFNELVHPKDLAKSAESFQNLLKVGHSVSESCFITKLGEKRCWIVNATKFNKDSYLGIINDITDLKKAEHEFMSQKQEMDSFFSLSPNLMCIAETDFTFRRLNPVWQTLLGYTVEELARLKYIDLVHLKDVLHTQEALFSITSEHSLINYRNRFLCKNGTFIWIEWDVKLTDDKIYALGKDVDSIIYYEDKLRKAKETAEAKSKAKSTFLANMSHEIKNPLNAIIGFSEILISTLQDPKQRSQIIAINTSGKNLLTLLNEILDLSKIEAGKMKLEPVPVNLNSLFSEIDSMFSQKTSEKGLFFSVDQDTDITCNYMLDESRLRQILVNLIGNAVKFTEKGYISMAYHALLKNVDSVELTITIQDTGIGIPWDQQNLIFEPFHQQENQDTNKFGGTGLGLSISKHLVEMMGGKIIILSSPGNGSIFKVLLPDVKIQPEEENADLKLYCEIAFEETTELTNEQKSHLPDVIRTLEHEFLPLNYIAIKKQQIEQIELFGMDLKELGEANTFQIITDYGNKICQYVDNFEIDNMMKTLKSFPEFIEKIKSLQNYAA